MLGTGCPAAAQTTVYDGALSTSEKADVLAWSVLYWQRSDQGGGAPGAGFAFGSAATQSPLFNPLRAARATLTAVNAFPSSACDEMAQPELPASSSQVDEVRVAYRQWMLDGEIATSIYENPGGTIEHANLILAATNGVTVYFGGNTLVSVNLPLKQVDGPAYDASLAMNLSQQTQDAISAIISSAAAWVDLSGWTSEAQKLIAGTPSRADNFAALAQGYLSVAGIAGGSVEVISAQFGVYGELPVVAIQLGDALVLMDPVNGNLSGPFSPDSMLDARGLLSAHSEYVTWQPVAYYSQKGCPALAAPHWRQRPPNSPYWPAAPAAPWPKIPGTPGVPPGGPGNYTCAVVNGVCTCTRTDTRTPPAGVTPCPTQTVCEHTAGCGPAGGNCPTSPQPPDPATGDTPGTAACPPPNCHAEYFY